MSELEAIKKNLDKIYSLIPDFECRHCHSCCGPIIWFKAEEILIKEYIKKNDIDAVSWTTAEFKKNEMRCPFIKNDRCSIYPVRPIVCRLQGNIPELPCSNKKNGYIPEEIVKKIKKDFEELNKKLGGVDIFYGTRKMTKI